ncbi:Gfo/Idh/MocA family oxidoreductase [uncultured Parabacteroides sp.]|uniref:Gfo/Idh/MocA family oxidoreductase n=1 Tax=uncultured Parabacteroides sp. TaxID=512312 RepID=UPI002630999F|nr:Gfo/Idh/MocA family oxidoreductase [uncultured Parabacteroides sp.]
MKRIIHILLLCLAVLSAKAEQDAPVRLGIIGLTHSHVGGVLNDKNKPYIIVGIVEPDKQLAERMSKRFGFSMEIVYSTMQELYDQQHPEAVACFNATYYHQDVVRFFAPKKIHIMVEKPFSYFCAVVKGIAEEDPQSTLQNNLIVMEILDAAKESASTGKIIYLK